MICFMISKDIERVVEMWKKRMLFFLKKGQDRNDQLFQLVEKVILFKTVLRRTQSFKDLDLLLSDFAEILSAEDKISLAYKFLNLADPKQTNVAVARSKL